MRKALNFISSFLTVLSFFGMIGTIGGFENQTATLGQSIFGFIASLLLCFVFYSIYEVTKGEK